MSNQLSFFTTFGTIPKIYELYARRRYGCSSVFLTEPPNLIRDGRIDLNDLTEHAAEVGLEVHVYLSSHGLTEKYHSLVLEA